MYLYDVVHFKSSSMYYSKKNMEYILKCPITESYVYPNYFGFSEPLTPFFVCMIAALTRIS